REQELGDELAAVGIGGPQGRPDRLARKDHHVPEFLEHVPRREKRPLGDATNHLCLPLLGSRTLVLGTLRHACTVRYATRFRRPYRRASTAGVVPPREGGGGLPRRGAAGPRGAERGRVWRSTPGRARSKRFLHDQGAGVKLPAESSDRAAHAPGTAGATHGHAHGTRRGGHA